VIEEFPANAEKLIPAGGAADTEEKSCGLVGGCADTLPDEVQVSLHRFDLQAFLRVRRLGARVVGPFSGSRSSVGFALLRVVRFPFA
jgi:hypothetical protein